jgi:UDP-glucose 4-epimerase
MNGIAERRVLVTGGAGFIGAAVARRLAQGGARVTVLDDLSGGTRHYPAGSTLIEGSVRDCDTVDAIVAGHSVIFHLAARGIVASTRSPLEDLETNAAGTLNLLLAAREHGIERFVYASSASIYGNPSRLPVNEEDRLVPLSPYGVSKLAGEHYCVAFHESYGVPAAVVRYSNVYGPGQCSDSPYAGVVTKFLLRGSRSEPLQVHGDGRQTRDFTFIDDAVAATLAAGVHPLAVGEVFNVGTGVETSVMDLASAIGRALGRSAEVRHIAPREVDNVDRRAVSIEKIRRTLRWSPRVSLEAGLRRTAEVLLR